MDESLAGLWRKLAERKSTLLEELAALPEEARRFRPAADAWSLAEVAHHLYLVEKTIVDRLPDGPPPPVRRPLKKRLLYLAVAAVMKTPIRVKIPTRRVAPDAEVPLDELIAGWDALRVELEAAIDRIPAADVARQLVVHPIAGPLDARESLLFLVRHFDHHRRQVERIRRSSGFPAEAA